MTNRAKRNDPSEAKELFERQSLEVAFRESATRSGFQVSLKARRGAFVVELQRHDQLPRFEWRRRPILSGIVSDEPRINIRC